MTKKEYEQIKADIAYIEKSYGQVDDYCGGWCNCDILKELLETPTYEKAYKIQKSLLDRYFSTGYDYRSYAKKLPVDGDKKLHEIKEKYFID